MFSFTGPLSSFYNKSSAHARINKVLITSVVLLIITKLQVKKQYVVENAYSGVDKSMEFKNKIQHLVDKNEKTYHAISKEIGVSHTTMYHLMAGNSKDMKLSTAFKLADYFGIDVNEFREDKQ